MKNYSHYELYIFDLDGTLLNTSYDILTSVNYALNLLGKAEITLQECQTFMGDGAVELIKRSLKTSVSQKELDLALAYFKEYYDKHSQDKTVAYKNMPELIKSLVFSGKKCAVVSNKRSKPTNELVKNFFGELFTLVQGEDEQNGILKKPNPQMVDSVISSLNVDRKNCLYIGDSEVDILTAKNSGIDCLSVSYGYRSKEFLLNSGAVDIADTPQTLSNLLLGK